MVKRQGISTNITCLFDGWHGRPFGWIPTRGTLQPHRTRSTPEYPGCQRGKEVGLWIQARAGSNRSQYRQTLTLGEACGIWLLCAAGPRVCHTRTKTWIESLQRRARVLNRPCKSNRIFRMVSEWGIDGIREKKGSGIWGLLGLSNTSVGTDLYQDCIRGLGSGFPTTG